MKTFLVAAVIVATVFIVGCRWSIRAQQLDATGEPMIGGPTISFEVGAGNDTDRNGSGDSAATGDSSSE